mmetsp:Transcript_12186/g.17485  ORF Transcript_12186/g.17485 Transcript_12186/m.17485 type:complete len:107 (+) Transcript_12186:127-447(+)
MLCSHTIPPLNKEHAIDAIGVVFWDDIGDLGSLYGSRGFCSMTFTVRFWKWCPGVGYMLAHKATGRVVEQVLFSLYMGLQAGLAMVPGSRRCQSLEKIYSKLQQPF